MSTIREMAGSLQISLKKSFDDSDVPLAQIVFWINFYVNKYNSIKIASGVDNGLYLSIYTGVPVTVSSSSSNPNLVAGRKYVILPTGILDLPGDKGINYISYMSMDGACGEPFRYVVFDRTIPIGSRVNEFSKYTQPSPATPYFYVVSNYVYLIGIECVSVSEVEMGLFSTFDPFSSCNIDENMPLDPALYADVYRNVLEMGRFVQLIPQHAVNDASDSTQGTAPTQRVVSINQDQNQPTE